MLSGNINLSIRPIASYTLGYSDSILGYCYYTNDCRSFVIQIDPTGVGSLYPLLFLFIVERTVETYAIKMQETSISDPLLLELTSGRVR